MPTYDYLCEANGRVVEVKHRMSEELTTWEQLCQIAGIEADATPTNSPVKRLPTGGQVVRSSSLKDNGAPACNTGNCCGGGMCGLN